MLICILFPNWTMSAVIIDMNLTWLDKRIEKIKDDWQAEKLQKYFPEIVHLKES